MKVFIWVWVAIIFVFWIIWTALAIQDIVWIVKGWKGSRLYFRDYIEEFCWKAEASTSAWIVTHILAITLISFICWFLTR